MALPILDGNQTSTTLATTVSGGAHYPNHIIDSGTVTANVAGINVNNGFSVPLPIASGNDAFAEEGPRLGVQLLGRDGLEVGQGSSCVLPISGTVTANGGTEIGTTGNNFGIIAMGVDDVGTANPVLLDGNGNLKVSGTKSSDESSTTLKTLPVQLVNLSEEIVGIPSNPLPISGTVTANITNSITVGSLPVQLSTTTIGGTARLNVTLSSATTVGATAPSYANLYGGSDGANLRAISVDSSGRTVVTGTTSILGTTSVTMGAISGTVTANNPSGALTTRFGSVTTANTAQLTAAVTNSARKYLLAQNISAGTVTIGIGFSPTTTQGIQLSAGGGLSFDSFCPTGAVWWLSATTGANFTILEV